MCGTTYNQLSSWTKEKKNLPKKKTKKTHNQKNTLKAYICEGIETPNSYLHTSCWNTQRI